MNSIINTDKINIYVSEKTEQLLRHDAETFEVLKRNARDINFNRFLSMLLLGYDQRYKQEKSETRGKIREIIDQNQPGGKQNELLARQIMSEIVLHEEERKAEKNPCRLSLKPTVETDRLVTEILNSGDSVSNYVRGLLLSYCEKPIYERERIIFQESMDFLTDACKKRKEITFHLFINPGLVHHVIPYEIVYGREEMFNYLLCQEYNEYLHKTEARSYRLCRIRRPAYSYPSGTLDRETIHWLETMKEYGPQYAINEDTETCVRLSETGQSTFRMIYMGRPLVDHTEYQEDGSSLYFFKGSLTQIQQYFRRFAAGEAEVLYPEKLRQSLVRFHEDAVNAYRR